MIKIGAHFITDVVSPADANDGSNAEIFTPDPNDDPNAKTTVNQFEDVKRQWTLAVDIGAVF